MWSTSRRITAASLRPCCVNWGTVHPTLTLPGTFGKRSRRATDFAARPLSVALHQEDVIGEAPAVVGEGDAGLVAELVAVLVLAPLPLVFEVDFDHAPVREGPHLQGAHDAIVVEIR